MATKSKTGNQSATEIICRCGCTQTVGKNSNYKPGHDARHASAVAQAAHDTGNRDLLKTLPSAALRAKAQRKIDRLASPKSAKATNAPGVTA